MIDSGNGRAKLYLQLISVMSNRMCVIETLKLKTLCLILKVMQYYVILV